MVQTAELIAIKHQRSEFSENTSLLVCNRYEVHGFSTQVVQGSHVDILESENDEITEFLSNLVVTIINKFHYQHVVQEELAFRLTHNLLSSNLGAVKHFVFSGASLLEFSWMGR